mmetsp:Transcript_3621/g.5348  ORF Transcript_3621/g.5348 Transcript_3621/m.5348 type:complete len:917 (+) Transcript_3621:69-2819(+)
MFSPAQTVGEIDIDGLNVKRKPKFDVKKVQKKFLRVKRTEVELQITEKGVKEYTDFMVSNYYFFEQMNLKRMDRITFKINDTKYETELAMQISETIEQYKQQFLKEKINNINPGTPTSDENIESHEEDEEEKDVKNPKSKLEKLLGTSSGQRMTIRMDELVMDENTKEGRHIKDYIYTFDFKEKPMNRLRLFKAKVKKYMIKSYSLKLENLHSPQSKEKVEKESEFGMYIGTPGSHLAIEKSLQRAILVPLFQERVMDYLKKKTEERQKRLNKRFLFQLKERSQDDFEIAKHAKDPNGYKEAIEQLSRIKEDMFPFEIVEHVVETARLIYRNYKFRVAEEQKAIEKGEAELYLGRKQLAGDDILPIMMYVTSHAHIENLIAIIEYTQELFPVDQIHSQDNYYLTVFISAVTGLEHIRLYDSQKPDNIAPLVRKVSSKRYTPITPSPSDQEFVGEHSRTNSSVTQIESELQTDEEEDMLLECNEEVAYFRTDRKEKIFTRIWHPIHEVGETEKNAHVFFVHGLHEHSGRYTDVYKELLSHHYIVHTHDMVSHGRSTNACGHRGYIHSISDLADDLLHFMEVSHMNIDIDPVYLIGYGLGASVVFDVAMKKPSYVAGCVFINASFITSKNFHRGLQSLSAIIERITPNLNIARYYISENAELQALFDNDPLCCHNKIMVKTACSILRWVSSVKNRMNEFKTSFLVIQSLKDHLCTREGADFIMMESISSHKVLKVYDTCHDIFHGEYKRHVIRDISSWINTHRKRLNSPPPTFTTTTNFSDDEEPLPSEFDDEEIKETKDEEDKESNTEKAKEEENDSNQNVKNEETQLDEKIDDKKEINDNEEESRDNEEEEKQSDENKEELKGDDQNEAAVDQNNDHKKCDPNENKKVEQELIVKENDMKHEVEQKENVIDEENEV